MITNLPDNTRSADMQGFFNPRGSNLGMSMEFPFESEYRVFDENNWIDILHQEQSGKTYVYKKK